MDSRKGKKVYHNSKVQWKPSIQHVQSAICNHLGLDEDYDLEPILENFFKLTEDPTELDYVLSAAKRRGFLCFLGAKNRKDFYNKQTSGTRIYEQLKDWLPLVSKRLDIPSSQIPKQFSEGNKDIEASQNYLLYLLKLFYDRCYVTDTIEADNDLHHLTSDSRSENTSLVADSVRIQKSTSSPLEQINIVIAACEDLVVSHCVNRREAMQEILQPDLYASLENAEQQRVSIETLWEWRLQLIHFQPKQNMFKSIREYAEFSLKIQYTLKTINELMVLKIQEHNVQIKESVNEYIGFLTVSGKYNNLSQ